VSRLTLDLSRNDLSAKPGCDESLDTWLRWLEMARGAEIDLGLGRCRQVAESLGLSKPAPTVITVAGTNGKGSSVAMLESIWLEAGYRVGAYTSPHLESYNERIRIAGSSADDSVICNAFDAVERARGGVLLTYFEFSTLAALSIFQQSELDIAILEVGLGGRLDAVNIVDSDVALITTIGLDHEDWLGSTREKIALEKAGVMRSGKRAVCSDNEIPQSLVGAAKVLGARLDVLAVDYAFEATETSWSWWSGSQIWPDLPRPNLEGAHQFRNAAGVLKVVDALLSRHSVPLEGIRRGLESVDLRGRFQRVAGDIEYVLDVAHNPQAVDTFVTTLSALSSARKIHALVGMLGTKNHVEYLRRLLPYVDAWYFATLPGTYGASAVDMQTSLEFLGVKNCHSCHATVLEAHASILETAVSGDRILVLGSFLTVGPVLKAMRVQA